MKSEAEHSACPTPESLLEALERGASAADAPHAAHLRACPRCAALLEEARELRDLAKELFDATDSARNCSRFLQPARPAEIEGSRDAAVAPVLAGLEVVRHLARGGCADVWLARDTAGPVALKVVREEYARHELEALKHYKVVAQDPRIGLLPILHITRCEASGRLCYTMPLADPLQERAFDLATYEPATLEAVVRAHGPLALEPARVLAHEVLDGLAELHERGLVHRDVKPANLLRYHGRWCLADTGLLLREGEAQGGPTAGTPSFLPPEGRNDHRTADLFALGKTLYFALTGTLSGFPTPLRAHALDRRRRTLYRRLYRTLARACEPERTDRFPNARQMKRALEGPSPVWSAWSGLTSVGVLVALAVVIVPITRLGGDASSVEAAQGVSGRGEWEVARLAPRYLSPAREEPSDFWRDPRLRVGSSLLVHSGPTPYVHVVLVLATYAGGERLVVAREPLALDQNGFDFGAVLEGDVPLGFLLQDPGPLLLLLLGSDQAPDAAAIETRVEAALDAAGGWPAMRSMAEVRPSAEPLVFHGTRVLPLALARGGPELRAGRPVPALAPERLLHELRRSFSAFDGFLLEVLP